VYLSSKDALEDNALWHESRQDPLTRDLIASDSTRIISDKPRLKQAVEAHIDWGSRRPSCFLSVFSDERHALNWAKQREKTQFEVYIYKIDSTKLPVDACVLDMNSLKVELDIVHPSSTHELLFLHRIPAQAVVSKRSMEGNLEEIWDQGT
jgi:hypothetical protein